MPALPRPEFRQGSYHFLTPPCEPSKPCIFYNTSACRNSNSDKCRFSHLPDKRSLRLVLNGPNICKDFLLNQDGCRFTNRGEGRKCYYSHDLTQAGLPLHDKQELVEHLYQLESTVYNYADEELNLEHKRFRVAAENGDYDEANAIMSKAVEEWAKRGEAWEEKMQVTADTEIARARSGKTAVEKTEPAPVIDVKGLSGANILRACGADNAYGNQQDRRVLGKELNDKIIEWTLQGALANLDDDEDWETENDDDDDELEGLSRSLLRLGVFGNNYSGFSEDDMMELACQGVKPWDDDAGQVLADLNGGF